MRLTDRLARLAAAHLYVLVDGPRAVALTESALAGGADLIQLRDKGLDDRQRLARAIALRERCRAAGALLIVNDRADIAALADADGVHLGQDDLPHAEARRLLPAGLLGASTHDDAEVLAALDDDACSYLGLGCCFPSATKPELTASGLALVERWAPRLHKPWFALGGVTLERLGQLRERGCRAVAVGAAVTAAADPAAAAAALRAPLAT